MRLKKNLAKHRLSLLISLLWAAAGFLLFTLVASPLFFEAVAALWRNNWERVAPLYAGLGCSLFTVTLLMASTRRFPYSNRYEVLLSLTVSAMAAVLLLLALTRRYYSGKMLCAFLVFQVLWLGLEMFYRRRFVEYRFLVFPTGIRLAPEDFPEYRVAFACDEGQMIDRRIDAVIVEDENVLDEKWSARLAECLSAGIPVIPLAVFLENAWGRIPLEVLRGSPDMSVVYSNNYMLLKAITDRVLAAVGIVLLLPVMALLVLLALFTAGRPVFFNQERCGLNNRVFVMYKFRTMPDGNGSAARATRFWKILRRYHLDELPQLFNVLKGELSLVGPRPETPELTEFYRKNIPHYGLRLQVNQGVVGWALIHQGNVAGIEDTSVKLSYDIYYIKHASVFLDVYIILKSVWLVLFGIEIVKAPHCPG